MSGEFTFNRHTAISIESKSVCQTLLNSAGAEEMIRKYWLNSSKVPTSTWLICMIKILEGSHAGASNTELFRTALAKDPTKMNMWDPISTVGQVGKWSTNFATYDGEIND